MSTNLEVEIKVALPDDLSGIRETLKAAGLEIKTSRKFEANTILDTPDLALRRKRELIRIRRVGQESILTYKGQPQPGEHKTREEIESDVADPDRVELIFARLGYHPVFRYEKFRTEFSRLGAEGVVTLDETPIGNFLEIEGAPEWIDALAAQLGFYKSDYVLLSYAGLYFAHCEKHGLTASNMVFPP